MPGDKMDDGQRNRLAVVRFEPVDIERPPMAFAVIGQSVDVAVVRRSQAHIGRSNAVACEQGDVIGYIDRVGFAVVTVDPCEIFRELGRTLNGDRPDNGSSSAVKRRAAT